MNLESERKIKFWLSTLSKVLIIALIGFKLVPFLIDTLTDSKKEEANTVITGNEKLGDTIASKPKESAGTNVRLSTENKPVSKIDKSQTTDLENEEEKASLKKAAPMGNSIGIFIFHGDTIDNTIGKQLENTIFENYGTKSISSSIDKRKLRSGDIGSYYETEKICIGKVAYTFKNKGNTTSCKVKLDFDSYDTSSGIKIKEHSRSISRYGIGFSKEEAKANAIKKIH